MQHFKGNLTGSSVPSLQQMLSSPAVRKKPIPQLLQPGMMSGQQRGVEQKEKYMRLRGKMRILQNAFLQNGDITDRDTDVVFMCSDGQVQSHKVVLLTASIFFNELFEGQKAGSVSSVIVPDISAATMKIILLLAYKDNLTLTKKQMRDVAMHLPMFGMDLKSFVFDETNLADQSGVSQPIRKPPPMISRPNPGQFQHGLKVQRQIGSITISGTGGMTQLNRAMATSSSGEDEDYKGQFRGYDDGLAPPPLKQIRIQGQTQIMKKKTVPVGNFRRIAPKPMPDSDGLPIQPAMDMTVGNQEIQFEDSGGDDGQVLDPEKGRLMIQEWMKNVGQPDALEDNVGIGGSSQVGRNQCLICNNIFDNPEKWRWHESHHVGLGIFKCAYCDELFSTSRKVYQHEMMEHGVSGTGTAPLDEPPGIPSDFQIVQGRKRRFQDDGGMPQDEDGTQRVTLVRTANGTHYRRIPTPISKKLLTHAKQFTKKPGSSGGPMPRGTATPNIPCGSTDGEIEDRKMKQLHWVYVCNKCQTCSDSLSKAQIHFNKCFTDKSTPFESSVMKYRQGFYGRCRCPLCPRRYTTNHGFTIHCGHMHNDFRRKFQHCSQNDTVACISCKRRFELPHQFHAHLGEDGDCNAAPEYSALDTSTKWIGTEMPGERSTPGAAAGSSRRDLKGTPKGPPKLSPQTTIAHGRTVLESQARSTRLANRRTMTHEAEVPEEEFEPIECPVCGNVEPKIVEHLHTAHKEMELSVSRISNHALRCLKCAISFAVSDMVSHDTYCCIRSKQFQHIKERKLQHPKEPVADKCSANGAAIPAVIPEGIGASPMETMEFLDELLSKDFLKKAIRCGVCGRINSKLGVINDCLRSHGIHRCSLCLNSYSNKSTYATHLRTVHCLETGRYKCPICERNQFVNAGQVAGHLLNAHWIKIIQEICADERQMNEEKRGRSSLAGSDVGVGDETKEFIPVVPKLEPSDAEDSKDGAEASPDFKDDEKEDIEPKNEDESDEDDNVEGDETIDDNVEKDETVDDAEEMGSPHAGPDSSTDDDDDIPEHADDECATGGTKTKDEEN